MGVVAPIPKSDAQYAHLSTISPEFAPLKDFVDGRLKLNSPFEKPINEFRAGVVAAGKNMPLPEGCPEIGKDIITADSEIETHGGGWVGGSHEGEEAENRYVASLENVVVLSVDYRLAPEYGFPTPLHDCCDVLQWCKKNGSPLRIKPENIIVGGSSSGGNLAASLALLCHRIKVTGIKAQVLNMPILCHLKHFPSNPYENLSLEQNKDASVPDIEKLNWFWDQYISSANAHYLARRLLVESAKSLPAACKMVSNPSPLQSGIAVPSGYLAYQGNSDSN